MRPSYAIAGLALAFILGCLGGGGKKINNTQKIKSLKTVALVGVCVDNEMGAREGETMARVSTDSALQQGIMQGFDEGFAGSGGPFQVTSLAAAAGSAGLPAGEAVPSATCASDVVPFQAGQTSKAMAYAGPTPDPARMAAMAAHLGVDAAVAVMVHPGAKISRKEAALFSNGLTPTFVYVVDTSGEIILQTQIEAEVTDRSEAPMDSIGQLFGRALAAELSEALAGK